MLERLGLEYLDLVYLHQPLRDYNGGWRALEKALEAGKVRACRRIYSLFTEKNKVLIIQTDKSEFI